MERVGREEFTFGKWLSLALRAKRLTQSAFAGRVSRSPASVSRWIANKELPSPTSIDAIALALDVDIEEVKKALAVSESRPANIHKPLSDLVAEIQERLPIEIRVQSAPPILNTFDPDYDGVIYLPYYPVSRTGRPIDFTRYHAFVTSERFMQPAIMPGDLIVVDDSESPRVGDIILVDADVYLPSEGWKREGSRITLRRPLEQVEVEDRELMRVIDIYEDDIVRETLGGDRGAMRLRSDGDEETFDGVLPDNFWGRVVTVIRDFNHPPEKESDWFRDSVSDAAVRQNRVLGRQPISHRPRG